MSGILQGESLSVSKAFEREVLAVHIRQRQCLSLVIKSNDRHDRIWSCTFPCKAKRGFGSCDFENDICFAMVTVGTNIICAGFGGYGKDFRIVLMDKADTAFVFFTDNDTFRVLQHDTEQRTDARRSGSDDQYRILLVSVGVRSPT